MSSILVLAQGGRTAPLRALVGRGVAQGVRQVGVQRLPARWREPLGGGYGGFCRHCAGLLLTRELTMRMMVDLWLDLVIVNLE